eukprot:626827-Prymnesium_polylepis.1
MQRRDRRAAWIHCRGRTLVSGSAHCSGKWPRGASQIRLRFLSSRLCRVRTSLAVSPSRAND